MLMLLVLSWGKNLIIQPIDSIQAARDMKRRIGGDRDYIIYESNFLTPIRLDRAYRQLDEEEQIEWLMSEAWPTIHAEGRVIRKNGRYFHLNHEANKIKL